MCLNWMKTRCSPRTRMHTRMFEGSLEVKLPTIHEKVGKSRFTVFFQWFVAPEGRKVGSLKRRVRSQLARGEMKNCTPLWREAHFQVKMYKTHHSRTTFGSWDVEKVHAVVARSTFRNVHSDLEMCFAPHVKMHKIHHSRTTFGSWDVEKVHAVVARSTFPSQNVRQNAQNTPGSDYFWKLRCRKSARRCGTKHMSKSKCTKHTILGPLLEVEMSKKCTPLWREAHFEVRMYVKMHKTHHSRTTFGSWDVEKVHAVVARSTFRSQNARQNAQNTPGSDHFWKLRCRKNARRCGAKHISKSKCTKHTTFGLLLEVEMSKKCTPLWREAHFQVRMYVKMHKTHQVRTTFGSWDVEKVHAVVARSTFPSQNVQNTPRSDYFWKLRCRFASHHYTTLHYTTLHSTTLHYTTLHYTTLHNNYNYTTTQLHSTTLHYTPLHYTTLHYTTLHYTTLRYLLLHFTTLHYTTLHYTPLH